MRPLIVANKGYIGKIERENDNIIVVNKFRVDVNSKEIHKNGNFRWKCKTKVDILKAANVEEILTGLFAIYIVVKLQSDSSRTKNHILHVLIVDLVSDQIIPVRKFECPVAVHSLLTHDLNKCVYLFNGPSVIICHKSNLSVYSSSKSTALKACSFDWSSTNILQSTLSRNCSKCCNNIKVKTTHVLDNFVHKNKRLLFTNVSISFQCETHQQEVKNLTQTSLLADETFSIVDTSKFFPDEYIDCITCVRVKHIQISNDRFLSELYLGTSEGFVVHVINGNVKQCVNVFEDSPVEMLETGRLCTFQDNSFICGKTDTFVVLDDGFQIKDTYPTYTSLITGDFLANGSVQCLFLEHDELDHSTWCLSDLKEICYSSTETVTVHEPSNVLSGIEATIKALTMKCQIKEICLHEEELRFQQRNNFIYKMFDKQKYELGDRVYRNKVNPQPNTIPFITSVNSRQDTNMAEDETQDFINFDIIDIWQRTWNDKWCIGINISCITERSMMVWADIVLHDSMTNNIIVKSNVEIIPESKHNINPNTMIPSVIGSSKGPVEGSSGSGDRTWSSGCESCLIANVSKNLLDKHLQGTRTSNVKKCEKCSKLTTNLTQENHRTTLTCVTNLPSFCSMETVTGHVVLNYQYISLYKMGDANNLVDLNKDNIGLDSDVGRDKEGGVSSVGRDKEGRVSAVGRDIEGQVSAVGRDKRGEVNVEMAVDTERILTKDCGIIRLNVSDVLEGKYELNCDVDSTSEDIFMDNLKDLQCDRLVWQQVYNHHHIEIVSDLWTICRLETILTDQCKYIYQEKFDWFISSSQYTTLCNVKIKLHEKTDDGRRSLTLYTCSDEELCLTVHHLYTHLPDSTVILPRKHSQNAKQTKCLTALQKEARFLHSGLRELLNDGDHEIKAPDDIDDDDDNDLRKVGEKFKRSRQAILQKQDKMMTSDKIKHFIDQYRTIQNVSDSTMLNLS
ncbi:hypothetical protein ACF0H5_010782 [Mactra antiquata]